MSRTTSEWVPNPRPSLTITAGLECDNADEFSHMTYQVSDPALDADPLASPVDSEPPAHQRSRLVQVFWDTCTSYGGWKSNPVLAMRPSLTSPPAEAGRFFPRGSSFLLLRQQLPRTTELFRLGSVGVK
ncbi:hypothetical protein ACIRVK_44790 [Streptomyces sp. NPDC101152]|uniref:hypothetical protein n=1 Tax=Streptomyces sp. NPDC101152 TaxID=3366116 RepID=UPI0037FFD2B2